MHFKLVYVRARKALQAKHFEDAVPAQPVDTSERPSSAVARPGLSELLGWKIVHQAARAAAIGQAAGSAAVLCLLALRPPSGVTACPALHCSSSQHAAPHAFCIAGCFGGFRVNRAR
jgi:hypothetical protein